MPLFPPQWTWNTWNSHVKNTSRLTYVHANRMSVLLSPDQVCVEDKPPAKGLLSSPPRLLSLHGSWKTSILTCIHSRPVQPLLDVYGTFYQFLIQICSVLFFTTVIQSIRKLAYLFRRYHVSRLMHVGLQFYSQIFIQSLSTTVFFLSY